MRRRLVDLSWMMDGVSVERVKEGLNGGARLVCYGIMMIGGCNVYAKQMK